MQRRKERNPSISLKKAIKPKGKTEREERKREKLQKQVTKWR